MSVFLVDPLTPNKPSTRLRLTPNPVSSRQIQKQQQLNQQNNDNKVEEELQVARAVRERPEKRHVNKKSPTSKQMKSNKIIN